MTVEQTVDRLMRSMEPGPFIRHAPTIADIVELVRITYGERAARRVRITLH